jgi:hypothetical protein
MKTVMTTSMMMTVKVKNSERKTARYNTDRKVVFSGNLQNFDEASGQAMRASSVVGALG